MRRNALILLTSLAAFATNAASQPVPPPIELSPREAPRNAPPPGPLFVSPSGEPFRVRQGLQVWFAAADTDHDGKLTRAEFRADAVRYFKLLDANADGKLDAFEIQAYEQERAPEITGFSFDDQRGRGPPKGGKGGRHGPPTEDGKRLRAAGQEGAARFSLINEPQPVSAADTDYDGKVTLAEWLAVTDRRFTKLDKFSTGALTVETLLAPPPEKKR